MWYRRRLLKLIRPVILLLRPGMVCHFLLLLLLLLKACWQIIMLFVVVVVGVQMLQVHITVGPHAEETKFPPRVPPVPRNSDGSLLFFSKFPLLICHSHCYCYFHSCPKFSCLILFLYSNAHTLTWRLFKWTTDFFFFFSPHLIFFFFIYLYCKLYDTRCFSFCTNISRYGRFLFPKVAWMFLIFSMQIRSTRKNNLKYKNEYILRHSGMPFLANVKIVLI